MKKVPKLWNPRHWASLKPFGLGEQRPNNYFELWKALRDNADQLPYAWRILNQGVCDGCALGTTGMHDWTLDGIHLCNIRLRLLRLNTMGALDENLLADVAPLRSRSSAELRELGRLPYPMLRRRGEPGFRRIGWDAALDLVAGRIRASAPERLGFYLTSRGMPNESYYVAQKAVRAIGTNSVDNAARVCHAPSTVGIKGALGVAATTCSYPDWIGTDLIVFIGSNVANNQPVAAKYLHYAKKAGTKVVCINPYREPGMERYWVPSVAESALFGTKIADQFFLINQGGDVAFLNGTLKHMLQNGWLDWDFVRRHTAGIQEAAAALGRQSWADLEAAAGVGRDAMLEFAAMLRDADKAVFVWSMGITQHEFGEANVRAIINLALTKGFVGREGCGVMPIRGHSGVQGGAEMGAYATAFPGGLPVDAANAARMGEHWGFAVPDAPGLTAPEMIDAAARAELDVLFSVGGNFLEVLPDPDYVEDALGRIPLRVHMDILLTSQMLLEPADTVLLLPAMTRYEIPGGVTETSTERRIIFSPEIDGPRIGEARAEWQVFRDLALRLRPELGGRFGCATTPEIRREIAEVVPLYEGIQRLSQPGDQVQYGGRHLCANWEFPTADGKAHFAAVALPYTAVPEGLFRVATRRGKQFNSMVHERKDAITGAEREAVLISPADAARLRLADGAAVTLRNDWGELDGRVCVAPIQPGNLQVHWPEGNVLLPPKRRSPQSHIPDYNAVVELVERVKDKG
jgi:molybdopterin-dependent oxidoreductase alpha subunit